MERHPILDTGGERSQILVTGEETSNRAVEVDKRVPLVVMAPLTTEDRVPAPRRGWLLLWEERGVNKFSIALHIISTCVYSIISIF